MESGRFGKLTARCPGIGFRAREPMARHVSFRVGGPADMAFPKGEDELASLLRACAAEGVRPLLFGAGTNLLPPDEGLETLAVCLLGGLDTMRRLDGDRLELGAGVPMAKAAVFAAGEGLTGLEFAHGIPGSVGGGIFMNAGAYGGELRAVAEKTAFMDMTGAVVWYEGESQGFGYRTSAFQGMDGAIVRTVLRLAPGDPEAIRARMRELQARRRASQPLELPSAGSTFKRPAEGYAAALIEKAGLKGLRVGGASVSEKHAGFVVNDRGATCRDILDLIDEVRRRVLADSGVRLEPEVRILRDL